MGDLTKGTYTMEKLEKMYSSFMIPDFCIRIAGSDVKKSLNMFIDNLKVVLSLDAAGSLTFDVLNAYDPETRGFLKDIKSKLMIGTIVTAEIGYAGSLTEIFKGYIHSVKVDYKDVPVYSVTCMDVIRLMQDMETLGRSYINKNPTAVFKEVMEKYKEICPSSDVRAASSNSSKITLTQKSNDYRFVKELCLLEGRDFFVLDGQACFFDTGRKRPSMLSLEGGKHMISFSSERSYLHKSIQIIKANKDKTTESILYTIELCGKNQKKVLSQPQVKNASMEAVGDQDGAKRQAEKAAAEERKDSMGSSGVCIGIPQLVPGRALTISGMDEMVNGDYEMIKVEHSIGADGYTTAFDLGVKLE